MNESELKELPMHIHWPDDPEFNNFEHDPDRRNDTAFMVEFGPDGTDYGGFLVVGLNGYPRDVYSAKNIAHVLTNHAELRKQRDAAVAALKPARHAILELCKSDTVWPSRRPEGVLCRVDDAIRLCEGGK